MVTPNPMFLEDDVFHPEWPLQKMLDAWEAKTPIPVRTKEPWKDFIDGLVSTEQSPEKKASPFSSRKSKTRFNGLLSSNHRAFSVEIFLVLCTLLSSCYTYPSSPCPIFKSRNKPMTNLAMSPPPRDSSGMENRLKLHMECLIDAWENGDFDREEFLYFCALYQTVKFGRQHRFSLPVPVKCMNRQLVVRKWFLRFLFSEYSKNQQYDKGGSPSMPTESRK